MHIRHDKRVLLEGGGGPDHVAARRVQHPLGLPRRPCPSRVIKDTELDKLYKTPHPLGLPRRPCPASQSRPWPPVSALLYPTQGAPPPGLPRRPCPTAPPPRLVSASSSTFQHNSKSTLPHRPRHDSIYFEACAAISGPGRAASSIRRVPAAHRAGPLLPAPPHVPLSACRGGAG